MRLGPLCRLHGVAARMLLAALTLSVTSGACLVADGTFTS